MLNKLVKYGIRGVELKWIRSYLENRYQAVKIKDQNGNTIYSDYKEVTCGVPQGSVLGPLFFIVYINDINSCLKHNKSILFADDTNIYNSNKCIEDLCININDDMLDLNSWFNANMLSLNLSKTHYMIFKPPTRKPDKQNTDLIINNIKIEQVKHTKFLGIIIDEKLKWTQHINYVKVKLQRGKFILKNTKNIIPEKKKSILCTNICTCELWYSPVGSNGGNWTQKLYK